MNVGETKTFNYTGGIQSFTVPNNGLYKLEVWGAKGGNAYSGGVSKSGGNGGYSCGYVELKKNQILYIVCGGITYNGGGTGSYAFSYGNGGGATHIAKVPGLLKNIGYSSFVTSKNGLIVAGGGGGACVDDLDYGPLAGNGGSGGGTSGGSGDGGRYGSGQGGTQTGSPGNNAGGFGYGGNGRYSGGAGGGFYGGSGGTTDSYCGAGGGSGWIGGVPKITYKGTTYSPSTYNGANNGNGYAKITFVKKAFPTLYFGDNSINAVYLGENELDTIYLGSNELE